MDTNKTEMIKIAGLYMAINMGAGYTSGQEILQFFSAYGWYGFLGGICAFVIMAYGGEAMVDAGWLNRENHHISVYEYFGGSVIGQIYNVVIPFLLYGSYIVMIAGAGSVLNQFFGIPNLIGRAIVILASVISIFLRFEKITAIISNIGKGIALMVFVITLLVIARAFPQVFQVSQLVENLLIIKVSDSFYGAGVLYACVILLASSQILFDTGMHLKERHNVSHGIFLGSISFIFVAMVIHFAILLYLDKVYTLPIITIYFAEQISPILALVTTLCLFIAMYSASTVCLWSVSNVIRKKLSLWKKRYVVTVWILGGVALILSAVPFGKLINILYPLHGIGGLFLLLLIINKHRTKSYQQEQ